MKTAKEFAPAKINLTLHITGQRTNGYHLLDSVVVFADVGDHLWMKEAPELTLQVSGPMAGNVPIDDSNLVLRAARAAGLTGAEIGLEKHLPVSAGIGGGSTDAAAVIRMVQSITGQPIDNVLALGADVPVCLKAQAARMSGVGEIVEVLPDWPTLDAVLINPGVAVSTPLVFHGLQSRQNDPMPSVLPNFANARACIDWLAAQRNDLEDAARVICPAIDPVLAALTHHGAALARMSGSGATCFGLFEDAQSASKAAERISSSHPDWWIQPTSLG